MMTAGKAKTMATTRTRKSVTGGAHVLFLSNPLRITMQQPAANLRNSPS